MLYFISKIWEKFNFLSSIYMRAFIAFIIAFSMIIVLGKPFIAYLKKKKFGEGIRNEGPESHFSKKGTPTMGGILIVFTLIVTNIITGNLENPYTLLLMLVTLLFSAIGFLDDYKKFTVNKKGLSGKKKILGQCFIAIILWIFVLYAKPDTNNILNLSIINPIYPSSYLFIGTLGMLIFIGVILIGSSNAVNLTDGLDGLAIMPVVIASLIFSIIAYFTGNIIFSEHLNLNYGVGIGEITIFMVSICGAGLGFLWYNFYPAQIFMGDTGSLTLGGILGTVAILLKQELLLPIIGVVFVMEAMSVIIQVGSFKIRGKRVFKMAPIHHHFELRGQPETKVTMRFWIIAIIFGIIALGLIRLKGII
ncbi:MAG: phospho-N-acetylmuramoyl-pentapeptide-transferase [Fusobacteriaceae bacterium]